MFKYQSKKDLTTTTTICEIQTNKPKKKNDLQKDECQKRKEKKMNHLNVRKQKKTLLRKYQTKHKKKSSKNNKKKNLKTTQGKNKKRKTIFFASWNKIKNWKKVNSNTKQTTLKNPQKIVICHLKNNLKMQQKTNTRLKYNFFF